MKKVVCLFVAMLLCAGFVLPCMASETIAIPSQGFRIEKAILDGEDISGCLLVTSVPQATSGESKLEKDENEKLIASYDSLSDGTVVIEGAEDIQGLYLELSDLRFAEASCAVHEDHAKLLEDMRAAGKKLTVTVKLEVVPEHKVVAYMLVDGKWVDASCAFTAGEETVSVVLDNVGPIVFVEIVPPEETEDPDPTKETVEVERGTRFVPSVTYKGSPLILEVETDMANQDGVKQCVVVTSVNEAMYKTTDITQEERDQLLDLYEKLSDGTMSLPLDKNHVVRELVDISFLNKGCTMIESHGNKGLNLSEDGVTMTVKFRMDLEADAVPVVMCYVDGKWEQIESVKRNADGTLTCVFEDIGPVAFVVGQDPASSTPFTGDVAGQNLGLWIGLMAVCAAGVVVLVILMRKKSK